MTTPTASKSSGSCTEVTVGEQALALGQETKLCVCSRCAGVEVSLRRCSPVRCLALRARDSLRPARSLLISSQGPTAVDPLVAAQGVFKDKESHLNEGYAYAIDERSGLRRARAVKLKARQEDDLCDRFNVVAV